MASIVRTAFGAVRASCGLSSSPAVAATAAVSCCGALRQNSSLAHLSINHSKMNKMSTTNNSINKSINSSSSVRSFATAPPPIREVLANTPGKLAEFFPVKNVFEDAIVGRQWMARDLRIKSSEDLQKVKNGV